MPAHCSHEDRWDHDRDLAKHDPRPTDRDYVPLCAQAAPISTAMDIALCVRGLKNPIDAAALIDQYALMVAKIALADAAEARYRELADAQA
jgi:hypothetical protein